MLFVGIGALAQNPASGRGASAGASAGAARWPAPALDWETGATGAWLNAAPDRPTNAAWRPVSATVSPVRTEQTDASPVLVQALAAGGRLESAAIAATPGALYRAGSVLRRSQGRGDAVRMAIIHASGVVRFDAAWRGADVVVENLVAADGLLRLHDVLASSQEGDFMKLTATVRVAGVGPLSLGLGPAVPGAAGAVELWRGGVAYDLPAFAISDGGAGDGLLWLDPAWPGWATVDRVDLEIDGGAPLAFGVGGWHALGPLSPGAHTGRIRAVFGGVATDWSTT